MIVWVYYVVGKRGVEENRFFLVFDACRAGTRECVERVVFLPRLDGGGVVVTTDCGGM
jgi:hypothetical protein